MVTANHLRDLGYRARERFDTSIHNCQRISEVFIDLCDRADIPATLVERPIGEKGVTHFVAMIPSAEINDIEADTGPTIVDPTIDQFSLANWRKGVTEVGLEPANKLPEVGIFPPGAEEQDVWYHRR